MGQLASFTRILVVCVHAIDTHRLYPRIYELGRGTWRLDGADFNWDKVIKIG